MTLFPYTTLSDLFTPGHAPRLTRLSECSFKQIIIDSRGIGTLETEKQCIDYPCRHTGLLQEFFYLSNQLNTRSIADETE